MGRFCNGRDGEMASCSGIPAAAASFARQTHTQTQDEREQSTQGARVAQNCFFKAITGHEDDDEDQENESAQGKEKVIKSYRP